MNPGKKDDVKKGRYLGEISIFFSALFLSLGTVFAKIINNTSDTHSLEISFVRFLVGLCIISPYFIVKKKPLKPVNLKYVFGRSITNTFSIILFFLGIQYTSVTKANMLNMMSPVFVFFLAPFLNKEKQSLSGVMYLIFVMVGAYFVITPDFNNLQIGDLFALLSGITAGISTSVLREARKYDDTSLILFYLYLFSTIISFLMVLPLFTMPSLRVLYLMVISGVFGVLGQLTMSWGFSQVDACMGSVISASRILFSGIMGILLFGDPINLNIILGGLMILVALIGVSGIIKNKKNTK